MPRVSFDYDSSKSGIVKWLYVIRLLFRIMKKRLR